MRKLFAAMLAAALAVSICACAGSGPRTDGASAIEVNTLGDSSMTITDGTLTKVSASVVVKNGSTLELYSGNENDFSIEVLQNGVWYSLKEPDDLSNTAEALVFEPGAARGLDMDWLSRYGALPAGHYRLVKAFSTESMDTRVFLADEFDIS